MITILAERQRDDEDATDGSALALTSDTPAGCLPLDGLIGRSVHLGYERVATVVDVVLTRSFRHVLGVDVVEGDERRFLPWMALRPVEGDLSLEAPAILSTRSVLSMILSLGTRLSEAAFPPGLVVDRDGGILTR